MRNGRSSSRSIERWEAWKKKDHDAYAVVLLAGRAAQTQYAGSAELADAYADYDNLKHILPQCYERLAELEQKATELVNKYWPAVQAIASELLNRPVLDPNETKEVFRRAMPDIEIPTPTH